MRSPASSVLAGSPTASAQNAYPLQLLTDIPPDAPLPVQVSDVDFNPKSGLPTAVTIEAAGGLRLFVATPK